MEIKKTTPLETLLDQLESKPWKITKKAVYALEFLGDAPEIKPLIEALSIKKYSKSALIKEILITIGEPSINPLIELGLTHTSPFVRKSAVEILGRMTDRRAVEPLIPMLEDKDESVCLEVVTSLGRIGDRRAVKPLSEILSRGNLLIKCAVIEALTNIDGSFIPHIINLLSLQSESIADNELEYLLLLLAKSTPSKDQLRPIESLLLSLVLAGNKESIFLAKNLMKKLIGK
ncbi:MAG: HEAT repeat domain-containing protein [Candidatus Hodarchaeota archaeon]